MKNTCIPHEMGSCKNHRKIIGTTWRIMKTVQRHEKTSNIHRKVSLKPKKQVGTQDPGGDPPGTRDLGEIQDVHVQIICFLWFFNVLSCLGRECRYYFLVSCNDLSKNTFCTENISLHEFWIFAKSEEIQGQHFRNIGEEKCHEFWEGESP